MIFVVSTFFSLPRMLSSCSPPVLFGHLPLPPPRGGSASRVSLVMIEPMIRILIEVGITYSSQDTATHCNTLQHTATHTGRYHILESRQSTTRSAALSTAFVSPPQTSPSSRTRWNEPASVNAPTRVFGHSAISPFLGDSL